MVLVDDRRAEQTDRDVAAGKLVKVIQSAVRSEHEIAFL
jgi:hypothetical protein